MTPQAQSVDGCWSVLGIDADADLATVKRAYALKLRVTRPDDDAGAYQALREAYEHAQFIAKQRRAHAVDAAPAALPDEGAQAEAAQQPLETAPAVSVVDSSQPATMAVPEPMPADAAPPQSPSAGPAAAADGADDPGGWVEPGELARSLVAHWQQHGDDALVAAWPALEQHLDNVPLALRDEATRWFAEVVLQHEQMPRDFVARLTAYFRWGQDFRVDQALGPERAERLRDLLAQECIAPIRDPAVLARYADLFTLDALLHERPRTVLATLKAWSFATLAGPALLRSGMGTPPRTLRALGFDLDRVPCLRTLLDRVFWLRVGLAVLLLSAWPPRDPDFIWPLRVLVLGVVGAAGLVLITAASGFIASLQGQLDGEGRRTRWFARHRDRPWLLAAAAACFALAWLVVAVARWTLGADWLFAQPWWLACWIVLVFAGTVAVWPSGRPWELLVLPVAALAAVAWSRTLADSGGAWAGVAAAGLWITASHALLVRRGEAVLAAYRNPWPLLKPRAWWGWLVYVAAFKAVAAILAIVLVLTLPLSLLVMALLYGHGLALAGIGLAVLASLTGDLPGLPTVAALPTGAAAALGFVLLQRGATRIARLRWWRPRGEA